MCFQCFIVWNSTIIPLSMVTYIETNIKTLTDFSVPTFRTDVLDAIISTLGKKCQEIKTLFWEGLCM